MRTNGRKALSREKAREIMDRFPNKPCAFVQWKGTDVCMDVRCKCGEGFHIDGFFAYSVKCHHCGTVYACSDHIELIELVEEPDTCVMLDNDAPIED